MSSTSHLQHLSTLSDFPPPPEPISRPQLEAWRSRLVGKTLTTEAETETESETETTFPAKALPRPSRVCRPEGLYTRDWRPERLNVHVDAKNVVTHVTIG